MIVCDLGASLGVQRRRRLPLLSAALRRSQRKEASVNQHEIEKDFIKHKCVELLTLNKSLHFSPSFFHQLRLVKDKRQTV